MTITRERRDGIRAAAEKATPGPWEVGPVDDTVVTHLGADGLRYEVAGIDGDYDSPDEWPTMEANAAHIANCDPQTILALLDAIDAAEKAEPVAVKPLVWSPGHSAKSPCGTFYIVPVNGKFGASLNAMTIIAEHLGLFETIDAAKTACEAHYEARIRSALVHPAPAVREGWKLVPVEPTEAMIEAGWMKTTIHIDSDTRDFPNIWAAMLAAAPEAK